MSTEARRARSRLPGMALAAMAMGALATGPAACAHDGSSVTVTDSAGVRLVVRSGPLSSLPWSLDTVRSLGGRGEGPLGFFVVQPSVVDVDARGRIYVLDGSQYHVTVFDSTGVPVAILGEEGDGPGELRFPVSVSASDDGEVAVFDGGKQALVRFSLNGASLDWTPFPYGVINMAFPQFHRQPDGVVLWAQAPFAAGEPAESRVYRLLRVSDGDSLQLIPSLPAYLRTVHLDDCGVTVTLRIPLSPFPRWSQWERRMAVAVWTEYRVDIFEGADLVASIRSDDVAPTVDAAGAARLLEAAGLKGGPCNTTPRDLVDLYGFSPRPQIIRNVALAPDGRVWVEAGTVYGARRIDIFDGDAGYIGSLSGTFPMPVAFLPDGRPLISVRDSLDVERLGITRVVER